MNQGSIEQIPFFFIMGRPRSGTTLLQTIFDMHPNVIVPPESAIIKECYERFKHVESWTEKEIEDFISFLYSVRKFNTWNLDRIQISETIKTYPGKLSIPTLIKLIYSLHSASEKKEEILLFGDKNPRYSKYPETILNIIPEAKFIHVVRDYRDHIMSMQRTGLLNGHLPLIANVWRKAQRKNFRFIKKHPDRIYSFRYEDFVFDPERHLRKMCRFLEIPFYPGMMQFHEKKKEILDKDVLKTDAVFHGNLFNPVTAANVGKWKNKMNDRDMLRADFIVGSVAEMSGYQRKYPTRNVKGLIAVMPGYLYILVYHFIHFTVNLIPINLRKKLKRRLSGFFPLGKDF